MKLSKNILLNFFYENPITIIMYFCINLSGYWIDSLVIPKYTSKLVTDLPLESTVKKILFAWIFSQILLAISGKIHSNLLPKFNSFIRNTLIEKIYNKFQYDYSDVDLSAFINKFLITPGSLKEITSEFIQGVVPRVFVVLITLHYYYTQNINIAITILLILCIGAFFIFKQINTCYVYAKDRILYFTELSKKFHDKLSNLFSVYVSGLKDYEVKDGKKINNIAQEKHKKIMECITLVRYYSTITNSIVFIFIILAVNKLYKDNIFNKEISSQMILTTLNFMGNFYWLMVNFSNIVEDYGILYDNEKFLESIESKIKESNIEFIPGSGLIEFKNVSFGYTNKKIIFNNFNLTINPYEKIAFIGPSGSGKSTLIKLLLGFYPLKSGKIYIDEQDISKLSLDSLRKNITFITQNTKLFDKSIYYNINYGNNKQKHEIDNFINSIGINNIFNNLPNGLYTKAGINGDELSGGQKQIVHILRGFLNNNNIVILDEPTSSIDVYHKNIIKNLIKQLSKGKTLILITHEEDMLDLVDKSYNLQSITT